MKRTRAHGLVRSQQGTNPSNPPRWLCSAGVSLAFFPKNAQFEFAGGTPALRKPSGGSADVECGGLPPLFVGEARFAQSETCPHAYSAPRQPPFASIGWILQHVPASRDGIQRRQAAALHMSCAFRKFTLVAHSCDAAPTEKNLCRMGGMMPTMIAGSGTRTPLLLGYSPLATGHSVLV